MSTATALTLETHGMKFWTGPESYGFAADTPMADVSVKEVVEASIRFPLAIVKRDQNYHLAGLLGLEPKRNLFVGPAGEWLGSYVPQAFRFYPFVLAPNVVGDLVFCVADSYVPRGPSDQAEPYFGADGKLSPKTQAVFNALADFERGKSSLTQQLNILGRMNLLTPWRVTVPTSDGARQIEGLYCVNEEALSNAKDEDFLELRRNHLIPLIYCQLLSMQNIQNLLRRASARPTAEPIKTTLPPMELDFSSLGR